MTSGLDPRAHHAPFAEHDSRRGSTSAADVPGDDAALLEVGDLCDDIRTSFETYRSVEPGRPCGCRQVTQRAG